MCDGFLNKTPEWKRPNVHKFTRKKMANFDVFLASVG
jgi:hypothetical protein